MAAMAVSRPAGREGAAGGVAKNLSSALHTPAVFLTSRAQGHSREASVQRPDVTCGQSLFERASRQQGGGGRK